MKRNTAKAVVFPAILLCLTALMSSCEELTDNQYQPEGKINSVFETSSDTQTICSEQSEAESVENISHAQSDEHSSDTEPSYDEYVFAPPDEVKNMVWYSDYIQEKIEYEYYKNDETIFDYVPEEVVSGIETYFREGDYRMKSEDTSDDQVDWIGVMNYDMNDDGIDDLLVRAVIFTKIYISLYTTHPQSEFGFGIYMLFLANGDGSYITIKRDAWADRYAVPEYILNTKTNGVYDLMPLRNGYNPKIVYDGFDSYSDLDYYDEKYIGGDFYKVSDDLVKITIIPRIIPTNENYYVAVKFVDNPFFKEAIAYTCLPDGSPRMYKESDEESIWDEGYIMYAELTENYDENELEEFLSQHLRQNTLEMRFVEVDFVNIT